MVNQLKQVHNVDSGMWVTAFPEKLRKLEGSGWFMERITSGHVANVALTDREMAIKLFGKEKVETENYHFLPIDTSRYPVYHAVNVLDVARNKNLILDRAKDKVRSYYLAISNGDSTRETELSPYINFFKELNTRDEVNFVYSYIQKYGQAVQATVLAEAKVEETANQPAL